MRSLVLNIPLCFYYHRLPPPSYSHREFTPQLDRISESPEDQLADNYTTKNENLFSPTSSMASVLSRLHYELPSISQHVQYPCPPPSYVADLSQSYPNLRVAPQPPFSPYHLTWMTPTAHRPVRSEPNIRLSTDLSRVLSTAGQLPSTPSEIGIPVNQRAWKSPYHPNYNTPTNGSDHDSGALPPHTVLNHTHSLSTAPGSSTIGSAFSSSDPVLALSTELPTHYNGAHGGRVLAGCESCASRTRVGLLEADVRLSAQANVRSWQYNQLYVQPGDSSFPPPLNPVGLGGLPDKAALEQHVAYGNCSMCAFMGSSDTSAIHAFSGNAMGPELPDLIGNSRSALPPYTQMDHQFLRLYDPGIASAPPYYVTVPPYESTKHRIAYNSGNTSMDAHRDTESLETSAATSTITGQASSRHSSGSTGGPSHSTSLTGLLSGRQSILAWPSRNTSASSSAFPGLSSLTPVLSGQTTNTPETSVSADSTSTTTHGQNTSDETHDSSNKSKTIPDENNNSDVMGLVDDRSLNTTKSSKTPGELSRSEERNGVTFARTWYDSSSQDQSSGTVGHTPTHKSHQTSTSGSGSFQWDSMRVSASFGDTLSSDQESFILGGPGSPKPKDTITGPRSSQPNTRGFEWDGYPFYTPEELRSRAESTDSGATIPRLINAHPVLANTQYWV